MKKIITFNEVIELNHRLENRKLNFKVHLHDVCGSQSFSVEPLGNCACEGHYEEMQEEIKRYFEEQGIQIHFLENNLDFIVSMI